MRLLRIFFELESLLFATRVPYDVRVTRRYIPGRMGHGARGERTNPKRRTAAYVTRKHFRRVIVNIPANITDGYPGEH